MKSFDALRAELGTALAANRVGSGVEHVVVTLPSFSMGESLFAHYARRIPALEHRYLLSYLLLARHPTCEVVFLTCADPGRATLDYYASLVPEPLRDNARRRFRCVSLDDRGPRAVAAKLLDRPDLLEALRVSFGDRPVLIEPWIVTADEVAVAVALQGSINGADPDLLPLAYKSAGRRLFAEAGVPMPIGCEDIHTAEDVVAAAKRIRTARPAATRALVKLDDSGAGDGNALLDLTGDVLAQVHALPAWYHADLSHGAVVEELIAGQGFTSPSVQVDIRPGGLVEVLSTHEQHLGGPNCQVYLGCRLPADPDHAALVAQYGRRIGESLAAAGVLGRFGVDFAVVRDSAGRPAAYALEINLRKGGTTHPYLTLRNLAPGWYDMEQGRWVCMDGTERGYVSTDNLLDSAWVGRDPGSVIGAIQAAGLAFDHASRTGVVLHMLSGLAIDGRLGLTAIGTSADDAADRFAAAKAALQTTNPPAPGNRGR